jgi:integrase
MGMTVRKLTAGFAKDAVVESGAERTVYWDEKQPGFGLMVTERGHRSWVVQYRARHRSRRMTLDFVLSLEEARKQAKAILGAVARGEDPVTDRRRAVDAERHALRTVVDDYFNRESKKLRSANKRRGALDQHVLPKLGGWSIYDIKRSDLQKLLDEIEDRTSAARADQVLSFIRRVFNWFAARSDDFRSPIVHGMTRSKLTSRERTLSDDEIRTLWKATANVRVPLGQYVRFLLLTACRRTEAAGATWSEFQTGEWMIPAQRHKSKVEATIALSSAAKAILAGLPRFARCDFVFTSDGVRAMSGFSKAKKSIDAVCGIRDWTFHDLRRTSRSLLSRAGVAPDIAERCITHVIRGVRGTYDRHKYVEEMRQAFEALAALIDSIANPLENVVTLSRSAHER